VLSVLFVPEFDVVCLFDHSCGHADRQREEGLNVTKVAKSLGGVKPKLRDSEIHRVDGFLGSYTHDNKLEGGRSPVNVAIMGRGG